LGKLYEKSRIINVVGETMIFEVTSHSYVQYETEPIRYTVIISDSSGGYVTPDEIENLRAVSTLTSGNIISNDVEFKGGGLYEIVSEISGVGKYVSKLSFTHEGTPHDSPIIEINIEKIEISIDTSDISPSAIIGEDNTYTINLYDSLGNKLIPDDLKIEISFPDGLTTDLITFDEITKIGNGTYEFSYNFPDVEKFSILVLADKEGYVRGSSKASVAVSGVGGGGTAGPPIFKYLIYVKPSIIIGFFILAFIIFKFAKRKK